MILMLLYFRRLVNDNNDSLALYPSATCLEGYNEHRVDLGKVLLNIAGL
jgi:hypothetical protein